MSDASFPESAPHELAQAAPFLSIIVPCFHSEKTISICLDSIEAQTYRDYEVVIVDSTPDDFTERLVFEYQQRYGNIRFFRYPKNGTPSQAAFGVKRAIGKYIGFVDSDDFVHPRMFEILVNNLMRYQVDISACQLRKTEAYAEYPPSGPALNRPEDIFIYKGKDYSFPKKDFRKYFGVFSRCLFIAKKESVECRLSRYESLPKNYWEDVIYDYIVLLGSSSAAVLKEPLYYYVQNPEHCSTRKIDDPIELIDYLLFHQRVAESLFIEAKYKKGIGQTYWPLLREFTYILHWPSLLSDKQSFMAFVKAIRRKMIRPLWKIPLSVIPNRYEQKIVCILRFGLYRFLFRIIFKRNH